MEKFMKSKHIAPIYGNKENTCYTKGNIGDKKVWVSRATAVCIVAQFDKAILIGQRGEKLNHAGKWCLPCGYVDYDETIYEAASRELYEEMGIYVPPAKFEEVGFYEVMSDPTRDELQNITFHFHVGLTSMFVNIDNKEVVSHSWITKNMVDDFEFAFNHPERILKRLDK
tara:strand:- start:14148 stop:14657 length:510 start_codon:yes stop_codon:yes gene_type:complete